MKRLALVCCLAACDQTTSSSKGPDLAVSPTDGGADAGQIACGDYRPLKNAYFGDLHAHTSYSLDAYSFATRNTPLDAYAFVRGKTLQVGGGAPGGPTTTIERPLDFLAVTDHSEWLEATYGCGVDENGQPLDPASPLAANASCATMKSTDPMTVSKDWDQRDTFLTSLCADQSLCDSEYTSAWQSEQKAAAAAYVPCQFTSFIAYEWTYSVGGTLHKNVIFRTDQVPSKPLNSQAANSQELLWSGLDSVCSADMGCEAITIPHNSNLSNGLAFVIPAGLEAQAAKYQKLVEMHQHKGDSECYYDKSPDAGAQERECDFEYAGGLAGNTNQPESYVRYGLTQGLARGQSGGVNPLMMGIVAATDDHDGTPGNTRESTWPGHEGRFDDTAAQRIDPGKIEERQYKNPGGLTAVWAEENTRDSIFAAFRRRETYGTSGTRMLVRFYQTWNSADPCSDANFPEQIVGGGGVPMGGTFGAAPSGASAPRFVVYAWKDKNELAQIDIVKLWIDGAGQPQQSIARDVIPSGQGNSRCFVWQDPSFTPGPTLYYARVLEVPTPRWSVYDCAASPSTAPAPCADGGVLNRQIQERAWTSPIWYAP